MLAPAKGWAVYSSIIFAIVGVSFGFIWKSSAAAPDTKAVDDDVPLM
jgi:hypothetical protein